MVRRMIQAAIPASADDQSLVQSAAPYVAPWCLEALLWPTSAITHEIWGTDPTALPWVSGAMFLGSGVLTWLTSKIASGRTDVQVHATLTTASACSWVTAATIAGPATHPLLDMWLIGGAMVAFSWNLRKLLRGKGNNKNQAESDFFKSVKLAKTTVRGEIEVAPNKVTAPLQLPPGEMTATQAADAKVREAIASKLSVAPNAVRMTPDPDHHDRVTMVIVPEDLLKKGIPWPGPSSVGGSIADPVIVGAYEDGEPLILWFPGDKTLPQPRQAAHYLVMGMNGSGKSHGGKFAWTEFLTRRDTLLWIADPSKGEQTLGRFLPYLDWAAITRDDGDAMIEALPDVITARATDLGRRGFDQWVPECGLPYLVVWIEEASKLVRDSATMIDVAQEARSAGVTIVLSMQRPSFRNITTDLRAQLANVWCFGVKDVEDAAFAVDEDVLDAGADPSVWKNSRAGYNVLDMPFLELDRRATPARTWNGSDDQMIAAIEAFDGRASCDPITAAAAGPAYANRQRHQAGKARTMPVPTARKAPNPFNGTLSDEEDQFPPELREHPEPDLEADADTEIPQSNIHESELEFAKQKYTISEARQLIFQVLVELRHGGKTEVGPKDIPDSFRENVRSRPWISAELGRLADINVLIETTKEGVYTFSPAHFPPPGATPKSDAA